MDRLQESAGVAFPFAVDEQGAVALSDVGHHIDQSIGLILATAPGERAMRPDFGCAAHQFTFETIDAAAIARIEADVREALERWEPRVEVLSVEVDLARLAEQAVVVTVGCRVKATGALRVVAQAFEVSPIESETAGGTPL